jgi:hypothetical protein
MHMPNSGIEIVIGSELAFKQFGRQFYSVTWNRIQKNIYKD